MSLMRTVRPSASNRLEGLKNSRLVWSMSRIATDSSSRPLRDRSASTAFRTLLHIARAVLVHSAHVHRRGSRTHCALELAGEQRMQAFRLERAPPERGGRHRHGPALGLDAHVEFGLDVDAHAILRDQRFVGGARHLERQGVHVDRCDFMDHRPDERAAVDDDFFAQEPGPDERDLLGRPAIEPLQHPEDYGDRHHRDDEPENQLADHFSRHGHVRSSLRAVSAATVGPDHGGRCA